MCSTTSRRPSLTMATRSARCSTSARMCDERRMAAPRVDGLVDHALELALHQRVQATRGLVEDEHVGIVHEGLDHAHLLLVAAGEVVQVTAEVEVEPLGEARDRRVEVEAPHARGVAEVLASGEIPVQRERAGKVADAGAQGGRRLGHVLAEDGRAAAADAQQAHEHADRRGLAGTVGAEEAEHLARLDVEGDVGDAEPPTVELGEPRECDRRLVPSHALQARPVPARVSWAQRPDVRTTRRRARPARASTA